MERYLEALLLGLIEGITEFLPISSTGHLLIAQHWLGARSDLFNIAIQSGAILAVSLVYRERIWQLASGFFSDREQRDYVYKLIVAFGITGALGLAVSKAGIRLPETVTPIAWALLLGGIGILIAEKLVARKPDVAQITWTVAILVGMAQVLAGVFPGTSRSAAAIFVALLAGTSNRPAATEFAFLVGIPTMFAATGYAMYRDGTQGGEAWGELGVAFIAASVAGFAAVRWLLGYIKSHRFTGFAVYRILLGAALLLGLPAGE